MRRWRRSSGASKPGLQHVRVAHYVAGMKPHTASEPAKLEESGPMEPGYQQWKQAKVEAGLAEASDRESLISAEQVWRDLDLEG